MRRDGWITDRGKGGGDNEIVAEEKLAGSVICVGFIRVRELRGEQPKIVSTMILRGASIAERAEGTLTCVPRWEHRPVA